MNGRIRTRTTRWRIGMVALAVLIVAAAGVSATVSELASATKARLAVASVPEYGSILLLGAGLLVASHSLRLRRRGRTDLSR